MADPEDKHNAHSRLCKSRSKGDCCRRRGGAQQHPGVGLRQPHSHVSRKDSHAKTMVSHGNNDRQQQRDENFCTWWSCRRIIFILCGGMGGRELQLEGRWQDGRETSQIWSSCSSQTVTLPCMNYHEKVKQALFQYSLMPNYILHKTKINIVLTN